MAGRNLRILSLMLLVVAIGSVAAAVGGVRLGISEVVMVVSTVAGPWIVAAAITYVGSLLVDGRAAESGRDED